MFATIAGTSQTPQATMGTIYEVNKLARKATAWARTPLKIHAHHSPVVVTYTDARWTTRPDGTSQKWTVGLHCKLQDAAKQRDKHVSDILAFESIETGGKIFICSRDSSSDYIRLCLKEVLFGQLDL